MPLIFFSLDEQFIEYAKLKKLKTKFDSITSYIKPNNIKRTYYVSPANSLCFMDGGIDKVLSREIFPNLEQMVKNELQKINFINKRGDHYLPIGSSLIINYDQQRSIIFAPTMLLPQNVSETNNAYYATLAILYNILINRKEDPKEIDILFTSLCCGVGCMNPITSITQIIKAFYDYKKYDPEILNKNVIIKQPNLNEQLINNMNRDWIMDD